MFSYQVAKPDDQRGFAGAAGGYIADANNWCAGAMCFEEAFRIQEIAQDNDGRVQSRGDTQK